MLGTTDAVLAEKNVKTLEKYGALPTLKEIQVRLLSRLNSTCRLSAIQVQVRCPLSLASDLAARAHGGAHVSTTGVDRGTG